MAAGVDSLGLVELEQVLKNELSMETINAGFLLDHSSIERIASCLARSGSDAASWPD
jgi:hypothetical protein